MPPHDKGNNASTNLVVDSVARRRLFLYARLLCIHRFDLLDAPDLVAKTHQSLGVLGVANLGEADWTGRDILKINNQWRKKLKISNSRIIEPDRLRTDKIRHNL